MTNLVGGDIKSLYALADSLQPCAGQVGKVVETLDASVKKISDEAGWSGDAAIAFQEHWDVASVAADLVGSFCKATSEAVHQLADNLSSVESALSDAADTARRAGVAVSADGRPPSLGYGPYDPSSPSVAYAQDWQQFQAVAEGFRLDAERTLLEIAHQIQSVVDGKGGEGLSHADQVAVSDYLRGIGGLPAATQRYVDGLVDKAQSGYDDARAAWQAARDATPPGQAMPAGVKAARSQSLRDLSRLNSELDVLNHHAHPGFDLLNTTFGDVASRLPGGVGAAFAEAADGSKALNFLSDIPIIDIAAVAAGAYFQSKDDIQKGANPTVAISEDITSNATGVAAGAGAAIVVGSIATAAGAAPVVAVGAAVVIGGAVAVGVGDLVYEGFHEDWGQDIHQDGVAMGLVDGTGHVFANTGKDLANMGKGIGHGAQSLWHGVFG